MANYQTLKEHDMRNLLMVLKKPKKCGGFFLILFKRNCQTKQERSSLLITTVNLKIMNSISIADMTAWWGNFNVNLYLKILEVKRNGKANDCR